MPKEGCLTEGPLRRALLHSNMHEFFNERRCENERSFFFPLQHVKRNAAHFSCSTNQLSTQVILPSRLVRLCQAIPQVAQRQVVLVLILLLQRQQLAPVLQHIVRAEEEQYFTNSLTLKAVDANKLFLSNRILVKCAQAGHSKDVELVQGSFENRRYLQK